VATLYKLTTQDRKTRAGCWNECVWGPGVSHSGTGKGELCGPGFIHAYTHPLLAVLLNPIHADLSDPLLWEAEGEVVKAGCGLKVGCVTLTTVRPLPVPSVTTEQRVRFAVLCAKRVYTDPNWNKWADRWLSGEDRSGSAAFDAIYAAQRGRRPRARPAGAARAAAADAARAARYAATVADYDCADYDYDVLDAAATVAAYATAAKPLDLIALAEEACR